MKNTVSQFLLKQERLVFYLFLISIFTFRIPNFYLIPFLPHSLLTIQAIGRLLLIAVFLYNMLHAFLLQKRLLDKDHKKIFFLIVLLFGIQSLSFFVTDNITSFLSRYKDILIGVIACFNFYFYKNKLKAIVITMLLPLSINCIYQLLIIINTNVFFDIFQHLIYNKHFEVVVVNLARDRTYIETYDEIVVPLLFVYLQKNFVYLGLSNIVLAFLSFVSNWRIRVLMFIFSLIGSLLFLFKQKLSFFKLILLIISLFFISFIVDRWLLNRSGFSFYDRILLTEEGDVQTITSRFDQIEIGIEMGKSNILGVGLGNYYDNLPHSNKINMNTNTLSERQSEIASEYIHNYLALLVAESGFISLVVFLILLLIFVVADFKIMFFQSNQYKKAFVISFWSLFLFAMLNPLVPGSSQVLFWGIRGLLID